MGKLNQKIKCHKYKLQTLSLSIHLRIYRLQWTHIWLFRENQLFAHKITISQLSITFFHVNSATNNIVLDLQDQWPPSMTPYLGPCWLHLYDPFSLLFTLTINTNKQSKFWPISLDDLNFDPLTLVACLYRVHISRTQTSSSL